MDNYNSFEIQNKNQDASKLEVATGQLAPNDSVTDTIKIVQKSKEQDKDKSESLAKTGVKDELETNDVFYEKLKNIFKKTA